MMEGGRRIWVITLGGERRTVVRGNYRRICRRSWRKPWVCTATLERGRLQFARSSPGITTALGGNVPRIALWRRNAKLVGCEAGRDRVEECQQIVLSAANRLELCLLPRVILKAIR